MSARFVIRTAEPCTVWPEKADRPETVQAGAMWPNRSCEELTTRWSEARKYPMRASAATVLGKYERAMLWWPWLDGPRCEVHEMTAADHAAMAVEAEAAAV